VSTATIDAPIVRDDRPAPLSRFVTRLRELTVPVALGTGAVVIFAASAMHDEGQDDDQTFVRLISGHINRWMLVHLMLTLGWLLLVVGAGALTRLMRGRGRVPFMVATPLMVVGGLAWAFENLTHGILAYALNGRTDVSLHTATQIQLDFFELGWTKAIVSLQALALLSIIVMGVGAIRSKLVPTWVGVLLCVALVPVFMAPEGPVGLLGGLPLMVGLGALARAAVRTGC
jgi:hypothetical protein